MEKIDKDNNSSMLDMISLLVVISVLTIVSMGSILVTYRTLSLKNLSYFLMFLIPIELILYGLHKKNNFHFNKKEILIFCLYLFTTLSLIGSNHIQTSIWGFYNRYEGLLIFYSYYSVALLSSTIKNDYYIKMIIGFILLIGFLNVIYGLFQIGIIPIHLPIKDSWKYARGFQGNSMYFASLLSICYFFVVGMFLDSEKKVPIKVLLLLILFSIGNVISGSMALFCTTVFLFLLLIIRELIGLKIKNFSKQRFIKIIICIMLFAFFSILFVHKDQNYERDIKTLSKEVTTIQETKKNDNQYGTGRIYIWKQVLKKSSKHLLFGVGVDNLYYSFEPKLIDPVSHYAVDKAHNDYLQKLLCEGVFSFICYVMLLVLIVFQHYKSNEKINRILFLGFFAYITQIFFSISVVRVAPIFWIVLGLLLNSYESVKNKKKNKYH